VKFEAEGREWEGGSWASGDPTANAFWTH